MKTVVQQANHQVFGKRRSHPQEAKSSPIFVTKVHEDQGIVEAYVSIFGVLDSYGDIIHNGAYTKTLSERWKRVVVLDMHRYTSTDDVIGKPISMREVGRNELPQQVLERYPEATGGLFVSVQFRLDTERGRSAFYGLRDGFLEEWSVGIDVLDFDNDILETDDGGQVAVRNIRTVRLWEFSPVIWGANPATATGMVKSLSETNTDTDDSNTDTESYEPSSRHWLHRARRNDEIIYHQQLKDSQTDADLDTRAFSLSERIRMVSIGFYRLFDNQSDEDWWVFEVFDDSLTVYDRFDPQNIVYQVRYELNDTGMATFEGRSDWIEGRYQFVPVSDQSVQANELDSDTMEEQDSTLSPDTEEVGSSLSPTSSPVTEQRRMELLQRAIELNRQITDYQRRRHNHVS